MKKFINQKQSLIYKRKGYSIEYLINKAIIDTSVCVQSFNIKFYLFFLEALGIKKISGSIDAN